jgi:hypothetical protein
MRGDNQGSERDQEKLQITLLALEIAASQHPISRQVILILRARKAQSQYPRLFRAEQKPPAAVTTS